MVWRSSRTAKQCTEAELDLPSLGDEPGPATRGVRQVGDGDRQAGVEALRTRALVGLRLQELEQAGPFGGGGHHPQRSPLVGQQ